MNPYFVYFDLLDKGNAVGQASIEKYTDNIVILHRCTNLLINIYGISNQLDQNNIFIK